MELSGHRSPGAGPLNESKWLYLSRRRKSRSYRTIEFQNSQKFRELSEAMREAEKDPWKACLVRIDRSSGDISIDFEYDHPEKWLIVPSTVKQMAESLRPVQP
jgi:hypothetical protein